MIANISGVNTRDPSQEMLDVHAHYSVLSYLPTECLPAITSPDTGANWNEQRRQLAPD